MRNIEFDKTAFEWSYYGKLQHKFKLNLRHLFCNLDFTGLVEDAPLLDAIQFLQELLRQGKTPLQIDSVNFPTAIIAKNLQRYLYSKAGKQKCLEVDRYEFLVYRQLRKALEACDLFVQDSNEFRGFDDDLINAERWNKDKDAILREIGAPILLAPIQETLADLRKELEAKYKSVNRRIDNSDNKYIKVTGTGDKRRWSSTIVRKLTSYTRQNQTKKALWELENICRSIHILTFIDDHLYRRHIQKALNRGEAYHRTVRSHLNRSRGNDHRR